ncbi:MAG TPA: hypothetical protein VMP01_02430 [Pirellulaceae bacterium]|nr:hypothetical protein [Pirellulaceae bacterium]
MTQEPLVDGQVPGGAETETEADLQYRSHPEHPASNGSSAVLSSREIEVLSYNYSQPFTRNISWTELAIGSSALVCWIGVFVIGLFVATAAMRSAIASPDTNILVKLAYVVLVAVSYTLTNVLFLSCLASFLGCMMRRWQVGDGFESIPSNTSSVAATRIYVAAVLRGFFLYLTFISGFLLVSTEKTVTDTEFAQYIRIAGMTSIVGFIVGYDPNLLVRLMHRILSLANLPLDKPAGTPLPGPAGRPAQAR